MGRNDGEMEGGERKEGRGRDREREKEGQEGKKGRKKGMVGKFDGLAVTSRFFRSTCTNCMTRIFNLHSFLYNLLAC